jgi:hypothetical protein
MNDALQQWETFIKDKPAPDIRSICARLHDVYQQRKENKKFKQIDDVFPREDENEQSKTLDDFMPKFEEKPANESENNIPIRYPKLHSDSGDFYAQFTHSNLSIMKKRPYESNESSNEGNEAVFVEGRE